MLNPFKFDLDNKSVDPRIKMLFLVPLLLLLSASDNLTFLLLNLGFGLGAAAITGVRSKLFFVRLGVLNLFLVPFWSTIPWFSISETVVLPVFGFQITGFRQCLMLSVRLNAVGVWLILISGSMSATDFLNTLQYFRLPDKLVSSLFFTCKFIAMLRDELLRFRNAARIRCFQPGTNLHTYRTQAWWLGMLIVRCTEKAQILQDVMKCRGYCGVLPGRKWPPLPSLQLIPGSLVLILNMFLMVGMPV